MDDSLKQVQSLSILGRISAPREISAVLAGYRAQAWMGDTLLAETATDGWGRFLLEWPASGEQVPSIFVLVFAPWGDPAGELRLAPSELLSPHELTFSAVPEPRLPTQASEPVTPAIPRSEVVAEEDLMLFQQAVATAVGDGHLQAGEARWVEQYIGDLDRAHVLARAGMQGDVRSLELYRTLLQVEPRWELPIGPGHGTGGPRPSLDGCFVSPRDPFPLIWAAVMLDGFHGEFPWSERAASLYNSRAASINTVFDAAGVWGRGGISSGDFSGIVRAYDPARLAQKGISPLPSHGELSLCLSGRNVCLGAFLFDLQQYGSQSVSDPPQIGRVVPDAVCEGYTGTLTLLPPVGAQFPPRQGPNWVLAVDGKPITIQSWDPTGTEITISFPPNVKPGCQDIRWVHGLDPEFVNHLREIGEQCAPFFGGSQGLMKFPLSVSEHGVNITVVGTPQIRSFTANGLTSIVVEACTDVKLEWNAALPICPGSSARVEVTLLANGSIRTAALSLQDSLPVNDEQTMTYNLRVEAFIGATRCSVAEQSVHIQRYKAVHLSAPGEVGCLDAGGTLPVTVSISCPAPVGGMQVTLASSAPTRLASGTVTIPEGSIEDFIDLTIGQECGEVTITATALGHQSASFKRTISDIPQITTITPSEVDPCQAFPLELSGSCLGERIGQQEMFLTASDGTRIQGKIIQIQANTRLTAQLPALEPGQYLVSVTSCGKTDFGTTILTVRELPPVIKGFSVAPNPIIMCVPTTITLAWKVDFTRRVRILRNGVVIPGSERTRNQACGPWVDSFTDPQSQSDTVMYTLEAYPGSGSPMKAAQAPVTAVPPFPVIGTIAIQNSSYPNLLLWFLIGAGATFVRNVAQGQVITAPLPNCVTVQTVLVDPDLVSNFNQRFGTNINPLGAEAAKTRNFWRQPFTDTWFGRTGGPTLSWSI